MLLHKAFELKPSLAIFAMYNGNDLFDAYRAVYYRNQFPEFKQRIVCGSKVFQLWIIRTLFEKSHEGNGVTTCRSGTDGFVRILTPKSGLVVG